MKSRQRNRELPTLDIQPVSNYRKEPLEWLWPGVFPLRKICLLSGNPELGKSLITLDMAARVSSDRDWPDGAPAPRGGRAMVLCAEDGVGDTIYHRLEAAGGDVDRVDILASATDPGAPDARLVSLELDVQAMTAATAGRDYRLIVIDPVSSYLDGTDMNSQQAVRRVLHALAGMAVQARAAVVLINHHRKKGDKGPAVYRTLGAVAFAAFARAVWNVVIDPSETSRRLMVPVKLNLAPNPQAIAYRIVDHCVVEWDPRRIDLTADEVTLQSLSETDASDRLRQAKTWLYNFLECGPRFAVDVKAAARQAGLSHDALWKAKEALKVVSVRPEKSQHPGAKRFEWRLPKDDHFLPGETEMLLSPAPARTPFPPAPDGLPPELLEMMTNLHDPSWNLPPAGRRVEG